MWSYSGVRPLYDDGASDPSAITRDYVFKLDRDDDDGAPALSIFGGKITTYRKLAEHALDQLAPFVRPMKPRWTEHALLPGGDLPAGGLRRLDRRARSAVSGAAGPAPVGTRAAPRHARARDPRRRPHAGGAGRGFRPRAHCGRDRLPRPERVGAHRRRRAVAKDQVRDRDDGGRTQACGRSRRKVGRGIANLQHRRGMSAAGPPQGARPLGGEERSDARGGSTSAAGPPQGARPLGGEERSAPLGGPTSGLRPLATMPDDARRAIRGVLTDIDDTLSTHGRIGADAYAAMERLQARRPARDSDHRPARGLVRPHRADVAGRRGRRRERRAVHAPRRRRAAAHPSLRRRRADAARASRKARGHRREDRRRGPGLRARLRSALSRNRPRDRLLRRRRRAAARARSTASSR